MSRAGPLGFNTRLDQELVGIGGVKRLRRKQVGFECGAGQVDQFEGQVRAGVEAAGQELHTSPERFEGLKFGVVEDVAEKLGHSGVDTRDQLGLTRVLAVDMWGCDLLQERIPGTSLSGWGRE